MEKLELIKNSRLENWLEKLQSEDSEKIRIAGEKIPSREIGAKNSIWKWMEQSGAVGEKLIGRKIYVRSSNRKIN